MPPSMGLGRGIKPLRQRRRGPWLRRLLGLVLIAGVVWLIGFGWFLALVAGEQPRTPMPHAGGIVVLTGGADRVKAGLELLMAGAAPRLLISGAGVGTYLGDFTPRDGINAAAKAAAISLGHRAATTRGNAREAAAWVRRHGIGSLIVVTADYHMPRALLELRRQMPGVRLLAEPVRPPAMAHLDRWRSLRLLAAEFTKYVLVRFRLGGFAAHHIEAHL
ncbi:YdcF family protein [Acidiphilium sp. PA]|uniref:YdcF family protein n=1 Tax=Acidiphilium sp. PA TaxID=2871705 RepID=UPI00224388C8|nr:YdcF family protein [Acidiphilium sp. PA]MCW8307716.1 YdcF family protein [Acidiphilium sp. PA]